MKQEDNNNRITQAIRNRDLEELRWAETYLELQIEHVYKNHPKKAAKQEQKKLYALLGNISDTIISLDTTLYDRWIISLFDHDEAKGDWRFESEDEPIEIPDSLFPDFFIKLNNQLPEIMQKYSDWQIHMGLEYLHSPTFSRYAYSFRENSAPLEKRINAILSIKKLYSDCFAMRCTPALGHLSEQGNELNGFCYMLLGEISPICFLDDDTSDIDSLYDAATDVLEYALSLDNPACMESALHGLGHRIYSFPKAKQIIQDFIDRSKNADPRILKYAEDAKIDRVL